MKKSSLNRQTVKSTFYQHVSFGVLLIDVMLLMAYQIRVVYPHRPRPVLANFFMALIRRTHHQRGIHMHIVTRKIQTNQALKQYTPRGISDCEKHQETCLGTPIDGHIQHGSKLRRLIEFACYHTINGVEGTGYAVKKGACSRVYRHEVEGQDGESNARIS